MKRAAFICDSADNLGAVYGNGRRERVAELASLHEEVISSASLDEHVALLGEIEVVFSTWGMPALSEEQLDQMTSLEAVFYAAGSVKGFARPLLARGITVVSGWGANARPVAEFTLAQILLACKGYHRNRREYVSPDSRQATPAFRGAGVYGETIGLIGIGMVGREVCELLRGFELEVLGCDPYLAGEEAAQLGIRIVELEELFDRAYVVSNHLPNLPSLQGILHGELFRRLRPNATFINTGRGAQVVEADLIEVLEARPDLTALLDVTYPEPPVEGSPLYRLPNVELTTHIAGSLNDEVVRMADYIIDEFQAWEAGRPLRYQVTEAMLETMA